MTEPVPAARSQVLCSAWATPADVPASRRDLVTDEEWETYLTQASEILWMLSGRRFYGGGCEESVTLRSYPPGAGQGSWPYHSSWGNCGCWSLATWFNGAVRPVDSYGGQHYSVMAVRMPRAPVVVEAVLVNGEPFTDWRMTRSGYLERTDGGSWNLCDDSTEATYTFGEPPGESGVQAAVELAIQLALYYNGSGECQLPQRLQSITRQGISMSVLDPQEFLQDGRTGMYMIDLFLTAVNPKSRGQRARVWSPDIPTAIRQ